MVMAVVTPQTDVYLLKCPLEIDQQNQLTFANATAQYNYFIGLPHTPAIADNDFTYQRKDGVMRYPAHIDDIRSYNYCMYRNDAYSNKWFFAFIDSMSYANDQTTFITLKTDVWQTWMFDFVFKRSFVEREHVTDDTIGAHTLDEGLPIGEPIINAAIDYVVASNVAENQRFAMQVTELPAKLENAQALDDDVKSRVYNGIPQGCYIILFRQLASMQKIIKWYDDNTKKDAILSIFIVPSTMATNERVNWGTISNIPGVSGDVDVGFLKSSYNPYSLSAQAVPYSSTLDGYTPKNNKLYCYPYSYLYVSNNAGADVVYHYEDWSTPTNPVFSIKGDICQGCSIQAIPSGYKKMTGNASYGAYGISCSKLPMISWVSDYYLNWQAQNGVNNAINAGLGISRGMLTSTGGALSLAGSIASGSTSGAGHAATQIGEGVLDVISSVNHAIHENYVADLVPNQAMGNTNTADLTYSMQKTGFTFRKMSCRREYAEMLDSYFSMFGYKINKLKIPSLTGRTNWNFVRTRICNIVGNVPQGDVEEMKDIMNSGITFWHNPATYLDYSQNNAIV